jgi:DtxR family Mn-dependent transcriptional regulator
MSVYRRLYSIEEKILMFLYDNRDDDNIVILDQDLKFASFLDDFPIDDLFTITEETGLIVVLEKEKKKFQFTEKGLVTAKILKNKSQRKSILQKMTSEDYLLAIDNITSSSKESLASMAELARSLSLSNSSISEYIRTMETDGTVDVIPRKGVKLTNMGREKVQHLKQKRDILLFFINKILQIEPDLAEVEAHILEHNTSSLLIERLKLLTRQLNDINFQLTID